MLAHNNADSSGRELREAAGLAAVTAATDEAAAAAAETATSEAVDTPTGGRATPVGVPRADSAGEGGTQPARRGHPANQPWPTLARVAFAESPLAPPRLQGQPEAASGFG